MVTATLTELVAQNVSKAILEAGHTPTSIAETANIPRSTLLRRLDLGQEPPPPFTVRELDRIARVLGTDVAGFFAGTNR